MSAPRSLAPAVDALRPRAEGVLPGGVVHGARHVAIIMDGNGRWAKKRLVPRAFGHRKGVEAVREVVRAAGDFGLEALTLYAFSSENWKRPADEISDLMGLLRGFIRRDLDELAGAGVRLKVIGRYRQFAPDIVELIDGALARTAHNDRTVLAIALNYGAQDELARAARALAGKVRAGQLEPEAITPAMIEAELDTADLPPLDLVIRTSGEQRLSNFLLWQSAYAEFWFTETLWPDFGRDEFARALGDFAARERRFGGR